MIVVPVEQPKITTSIRQVGVGKIA